MQNERGDGASGERREGLARLPAVSRVLALGQVADLARLHGPGLVTDLVREEIERLRQEILAGEAAPRGIEPATVAARVTSALARLLAPRPRAVINATGVVIHTNLGRAPLSTAAAERVAEAARGYVDLEYDLERGGRGDRLAAIEPLFARLFPGVAFTVVNNNAAALLLALHALSPGREVLVSRGELVEIGGSFRVPDILAASGALLREVGTTNRTRRSDYERALSTRTGMLLKVHTSNFRIVGFTAEASVADLAEVSRKSGLPLVVDWGSGDLVDLAPLGIADELPVARILAAGADVVTFSGDKLFGGPQAGFLVGRATLVERLRRDPLSRALRLDRLRIGALAETLAAHLRGRAVEEVPVLRMIAISRKELDRRARSVVREIQAAAPGARLSVIDGVSRTGGGSSPTGERPTRLVAVEGEPGALERRLRGSSPPVIGRIQDGRFLLDLRTVLPEEQPTLVARLIDALS